MEGHIQIICSPILGKEEQLAMQEGYKGNLEKELGKALIQEAYNLLQNPTLQKPARILAGLIANGTIEVKIAAIGNPKVEIQRLFHDKVGIFKDAKGNGVGFRGSMNETFMGFSKYGNFESIDVFPNWVGERDKKRMDNALNYFESLWEGKVPGIQIFEIPQAAKELFDKIGLQDNWKRIYEEMQEETQGPEPVKQSALAEHQMSGLMAWKQNNYHGILDYATGTGKTRMALKGIEESLERGKRPIIIVPSKDLFNQ